MSKRLQPPFLMTTKVSLNNFNRNLKFILDTFKTVVPHFLNVHRATVICDERKLRTELNRIKKLVAWNVFPS